MEANPYDSSGGDPELDGITARYVDVQAVLTGKGWENISVPNAVRRQAETAWFQSFLAFDPAKVMKDVDQPILIVQGMLDTQVPPSNADTLETLARARRKAGPVDVVKVPGVNHLRTHGRWDFVEFADLYEMEADFARKVEGRFNEIVGERVREPARSDA